MNDTTINPKKKSTSGRPVKFMTRVIKVASLLPVDGSCVRFKDLDEERKKHGISYRILWQELDRLQRAGTIIKEAILVDGKPGTCYRLNVLNERFEQRSPTNAFLDFRDFFEDMVEGNSDKNYAEKYAAQGFYFVYATIMETLLNEFEVSRSYSEPDERFDSALNDFIVPLIKRLLPYFQHPAIDNEHAKSAIFKAIIHGSHEWDKVWDISATNNVHRTDDKKIK